MPRSHPILLSCVQFDAALKAGAMAVTDLAPIAARLGVDGVEYREVYWRDKEAELPAVREQIERLGLRLTYCTFTPLFNADPVARRQLLTDIDDAAALGSPLLRVFLGVRDMPPAPSTEIEAIASVDVLEGATEAVERAGEHGLRLALENHANVLGPRWEQIRDALTMIDSSVMGTNIDTANYIQNGEPLMTAIAELTPWIIYSHLKDVRAVDGGYAVLPLGQGELDFGAILAAYDVAGADFPLCFEFPGGADPEAAISASLDYIKRVMARAED
jgi:sugar phosphate isomerase/epimerase